MQEALTRVMKNLIEAIYTQDTPEKAIEWCMETSELALGENYKNELVKHLKTFIDNGQ